MALTKTTRHRAPLDGTWFRTEAHLDSLLRSAAQREGGDTWDRYPSLKIAETTWVPIWVRMELYEAQRTPNRPDGMMALSSASGPCGPRRSASSGATGTPA